MPVAEAVHVRGDLWRHGPCLDTKEMSHRALAFRTVVAMIVLAPVALQARQPVDARVIVQFQRARIRTHHHRQTERRGTSPARR